MMNNEGMKPIGLRIKARREDLGLTQEELARRLGYKSKSSLNKIELGIQGLRQSKIKAIADALQTTPGYIMGWTADKPAAAPSQDPLRDYYDQLIRYLDSSPAHRQLISDASHVRAEDIDMIRPLLQRCVDPDSSAPELPALDTSPDTLDTSEDTSTNFQGNFQALPGSNHGQATDPQEAPEKILRNARNSCDCVDARVELTDETLALVRDTPEVLLAEAEYIKKMSVKPPRKGATASPSTDAKGRKSG